MAGEYGERVVACDLSHVDRPTLATVDSLARLHLALSQLGYRLRIEAAPPMLVELIGLCGLAEVLRTEKPQPE